MTDENYGLPPLVLEAPAWYSRAMTEDPRALKDQLRRIGYAKDAARAEDAEAWLALPLQERILTALRHCDAVLALNPPPSTDVDDEHEVWARVNRYLQALQ